MYASARGIAANGVIQIDPQGLAAILEGIGPVDVPGLGQVSAANVVDFTLNRAYFQFPGVEERSDVLGDIAEATFKKLVNGEYGSLRPLATALQRTVVGHHLLMYATEQQTERQLRWFGVDGELPGGDGVDAFHLTSQNLSANKLDYYVDSSLKLTGERLPGRIGDVTAEITLTNTAPAGQGNPRYVFGPGGGSGQAVGQYRSAVSLYVPTGTEIVGTNGETIDTPSVDTEGGHTVIGFTVDVLAAKAATVTLQLRLAPRPASPYVMFLTPSPRVRPTTVAVDLDLGDGKRLTSTVALDRTWALVPGAKPLTIAPRQLPRLPAVG
jgi:hypothetical protein